MDPVDCLIHIGTFVGYKFVKSLFVASAFGRCHLGLDAFDNHFQPVG